jgi:hypothetical protein
MDIVIKRTNHTLFQVDNVLGTILLEAFPTRFQRYEKPAPIPAPATWAFVENPISGNRSISCKCPTCRASNSFLGSPDNFSRFEKTLCVHAGPCPESVIQQYEKTYVPQPAMSAEYWRAVHSK